jgi:hypothetical protein
MCLPSLETIAPERPWPEATQASKPERAEAFAFQERDTAVLEPP